MYQSILRFGQDAPVQANSILVDGAHHSRELTSVQMVCYTMLRVLFEYELEADVGVWHAFFSQHSIYFIPIVNVDGHHEISEFWH